MSTRPPLHRVALDAPAKVNLWLHVLAREESGFHQIETLFCALDLADRVEIETADALSLDIDGPDVGPIERNLAFRAAQSFYAEAHLDQRARIRLTKRIPAGAGLGGGSSDAAATLRALNALHGEPLDGDALMRIGAALGSDVPFFLSGSPTTLAWGRGDRLLPIRPPPAAPALVVAPQFASATAGAYAALAQRRANEPVRPTCGLVELRELKSWNGIAAVAENDFEPVLFELHANLASIKESLLASGAKIALLAGSGSALFGIFARTPSRDRAAARIADHFADCNVLPCATAATVPQPQPVSVDSSPLQG